MKVLGIFLVVACCASPTFASKELAKKSNCLGCHAVNKKLVGPAYQDVAQKYANQKNAQDVLSFSIKKGGQGKWGVVAMPAQESLSESDARVLAKWILEGAK